ncbi:MAG: aspartate--tRNA(Asn) ligase [Candidatus Blackburnbacteria bacterium]|nr:aspartate--tRNA(Asn) ligase [Candidatus Blackburnbacteria bacterium]
MKKRVLSSELKSHIGEEVLLQGWLHKRRELGGMTFLVLRDGHGLVQILAEKSQETEKLDGLQNGTILTVVGTVVEDERAPQGVEIHNPELVVEVPVEYVAPIEIDKPIDHTPDNLETLFENRVVNIRNVTEQGIFKIQQGVGDAIREYLKSQDFTEFHSPKLLSESTEGGAEVFELNYFDKKATLAQSAQFYKQIMVGTLERVFEFGAVYRAEPSMTTRHMTEYITVDVEMGFIKSFQDVMNLLSELTNSVCDHVWQNYETELLALKAQKPVLKAEFPQITLNDLHKLYLKETEEDMRGEPDPAPAEERFICEYSAKNWGSEAVFITEWPSSHMKFYHFRSETNPEVAVRADLIFRGVEIVTTSQREHRYEKLLEQLKEMGGDPKHPGFKYYLDAFKYGMPSHGGFGLGLERLTQKIIGLNNVKEATLFPRDINRLSP